MPGCRPLTTFLDNSWPIVAREHRSSRLDVTGFRVGREEELPRRREHRMCEPGATTIIRRRSRRIQRLEK